MISVSFCDREKYAWNLWDRGTRCFSCWLWFASKPSRLKAFLSYNWIFNRFNENSRPRKQLQLWVTVVCNLLSSNSIWKVVTWLILPVVICLSQRLSHACLSINKFVLWNCEWLIKSVIVYLMLTCYMDNCGNSRANTCNQAPTSGRGVFIR